MRSEEDDFDSLRCLLALKRHEVPPPGFFDAFPEAVRARLRTGRTATVPSWWKRVFRPAPWRPALAGACALAVGGVVIWQAGFGPPHRLPAFGNLSDTAPAPAHTQLNPLRVLSAGAGLATAEPAAATGSSMRPMLGARPPSWLFAPGVGIRSLTEPAAAYVEPAGMVVTGLQSGAVAPLIRTNSD